MSGTGPKAGGPRYVPRFASQILLKSDGDLPAEMSISEVETLFGKGVASFANSSIDLPGPTGESNRYSVSPKGRILCMGAGADEIADRARNLGCNAIAATLNWSLLRDIEGLEAVVYAGSHGIALRTVLSELKGPIVPLLMHESFEMWIMREQSVCIDTTAAGGNAVLLASET